MPAAGRRRRLTVAVLVGAFLGSAAAHAASRPPNIVLIVADDLGFMDLGSYGNRFNETPRLDRLAAEGLRFTDFYSASPVCSPTRASILTGQDPARLGMTAHIPGHWRPFERLVEPPTAIDLPAGIPTVAEVLRRAGYATAHYGKWHLSWLGPRATGRGFDESFEIGGHVVPPERRLSGDEGSGRVAETISRRAAAFMEAHREQPFFIYLCHNAVHIPLAARPDLRAKYRAKPKAPGYRSLPEYAALLEEMDEGVGIVLDAIARLGLERDTVVVFVSDNGGLEEEAGGYPATTNDPLRDEKGSLYEGGIRVPLIVRWPGVAAAGRTSATVGITTDFFPTFLEIAGVSPPTGHTLDGVSLLAVLRDPDAAPARDALFWHYPHYHHSRPADAMREGRFKLLEFFDTGEAELYDLASDLGEARDVAAEQPERVARMRDRLEQYRDRVNAQLPRSNPGHDPARAGEWWSRMKMEPTEAPGTPKPGELQ